MEVIPYDFCGKTVQIITDDDGNPWWVAADVCRCLGLVSPTHTVKALDDYEKSTLRLTKGGPKRNIINESGLYHLLSKSTKKLAQKFRRWCFGEVLPTIRKTGSYALNKADLPTTQLGWMRLAVEKEEARIKATEETKIAKKETKVVIKEIKKLRPKADALDTIANCEGLVSFTKAGKILGIKPKSLIAILLLHKVIYRTKNNRGDLLPFQYFLNYGWFEVKSVGPERKYTQTLVTQFGLTKLGTRFSRFFEKNQ